jgi:ADP-heptose:LPS heptosyltransferase
MGGERVHRESRNNAGGTERFVSLMIERADAARDQGHHELAAALYGEALTFVPKNAGLQIQCGHMLKEVGRLKEAEAHYLKAYQLLPDDADLATQLGHFYKVSGRLTEARQHYCRAIQLSPDSSAARHDLEVFDRDRRGQSYDEQADSDELCTHVAKGPRRDMLQGWTAGELDRLVPKIVPRRLEDILVSHDERIEVRRLGRREEGFWGTRRTLRGVEAVHGYVLSERPILEVQVLVNGIQLFRGPMRGGYQIDHEQDKRRIRKYVFNHWIDFSDFAPGLHALDLRFFDARETSRSWHDRVVIAAPVDEALYPDSDFLISPDRADARSLEQQIRDRPSQVHEAKRKLFPDGVKNVLVMRTDQLGDMVASIPAMQRLRELLPHARLVGLMTPANAELARTLTGLFDEVLTVDFPDILIERRRVMPFEKQEALRKQLAPYEFDIAIDLARAGISRDLLRLSGGKFLYGVGGEEWPFLSSHFIFNTHDRWTGHDMTPHSTKVLALIEGLGTILRDGPPIIRRSELSRDIVQTYGIGAQDRYVVLHMGARIGFSRWPYHPELVRMLLDRTAYKIVAITEEAGVRETFPSAVLDDPRFIFLDKRLPFDHFDALLSFASVMVGNDSGPKHLASLRGTQVVTIFSSRINWTEWGQENVGVIVSRKVPCAGCAILHEPEDCGKDFACIVDIRPEEVFQQVTRLAEIAEAAGS